MQTMAQEKPGLFKTVKEWIGKWIRTIREAFLGVSEVHEEARAVAEMELDRLQKLTELWDRGLIEASDNAQKSPAKEDGAVKYSIVGVREDGIEVYETSKETKELSWKERKKRFMARLKSEYKNRRARFKRNGHTYYASFKDVDLQKTVYGDRESDNKGYGAKINAGAEGDYFDLLEDMHWFDGEKERGKTGKAHERVKYWNYYIKTVQIDGRVFDLLANVRHRADGAFSYNLELYERNGIEAASPPSLSKGKASLGVPTASETSILPSSENSNTKFQERDYLPDDRALLMAAEARGAGAEELQAYQKKVKALEALERKLGRQREALAAAKGDRKALEEAIRKTEASIVRAENALDEMERSPKIRQAAERALAEWREANPNEAARALREMREEQRTLQKYVELLRQEAKLTTPGERTLLPSDVQKLARALIKEQGSFPKLPSCGGGMGGVEWPHERDNDEKTRPRRHIPAVPDPASAGAAGGPGHRPAPGHQGKLRPEPCHVRGADPSGPPLPQPGDRPAALLPGGVADRPGRGGDIGLHNLCDRPHDPPEGVGAGALPGPDDPARGGAGDLWGLLSALGRLLLRGRFHDQERPPTGEDLDGAAGDSHGVFRGSGQCLRRPDATG